MISILTDYLSVISESIPGINEPISLRHGLIPVFNKHLSFINDQIPERRGPG
jgi:hypothetical protein